MTFSGVDELLDLMATEGPAAVSEAIRQLDEQDFVWLHHALQLRLDLMALDGTGDLPWP